MWSTSPYSAPSLRSLTTTGRLSEPQGSFADQSSVSGEARDAILGTLSKPKGKAAKATEGPGGAFTAPESVSNEEASTAASSSSSSTPPAASAPSPVASVAEATESTTDKFTNLKDKINPDVYKALTQRPFNFEKMSSVQEAVLNLLPELAKTPSPVEAGEQAEVDPRQDLLVKAKTGTGKTVAFLVPALEARFNDIEQERQRFIKENPK